MAEPPIKPGAGRQLLAASTLPPARYLLLNSFFSPYSHPVARSQEFVCHGVGAGDREAQRPRCPRPQPCHRRPAHPHQRPLCRPLLRLPGRILIPFSLVLDVGAVCCCRPLRAAWQRSQPTTHAYVGYGRTAFGGSGQGG